MYSLLLRAFAASLLICLILIVLPALLLYQLLDRMLGLLFGIKAKQEV